MNLTVNSNKLKDFPGLESSPYASFYQIGRSLSIQRLYTFQGVNPETGEYQVKDFDESETFDEKDKQFMLPLDPKFYGGLVNTLSFGSIELSFLFQFTKQVKQIVDYGPAGLRSNMPTSVMARWQQEGDIADVAKFSTTTSSFYSNYVYQSDFATVDGSFIRLKTLSLSYGLPATWLSKIKLQQAKVFFQGQNLFTITDYPEFDPETGGNMPPLRILSAGVHVKI
jgi:hypothetical protein